MMETVSGRYSLQQDQYSPHIKRVLKSYRSTAMDSLSGPREYAHFKREATVSEDDCLKLKASLQTSCVPKTTTAAHVLKPEPEKLTCEQSSEASGTKTCSDSDSPSDLSPSPPRVPIPPPILSAPDQEWGEVGETILEGESISCFSVGGEKRLCLPQVLNSVLRGVSISQIHGVCDDLHIFCSTCSKEQLDVLKNTGILPPSASQCGLITKTDAERLCSELLNASAPQLLKTELDAGVSPTQRMNVHHKCFGKCRGTLRLELYTSPPSRCIECNECRGIFAPIKFVSHTHENRETRTVHWGFDSAQWRHYLLLCPGQPGLQDKEVLFKEFKKKFDSTLKRKQSPAEAEGPEEKRARLEESAPSAALLYAGGFLDPALLYRYYSWPPPAPAHTATSKETTRLPPQPPQPQPPRSFLSHDPPVLLHPDRVVTTDDAKQHERHFQPNVALAPHKPTVAQGQPSEPDSDLVADPEVALARVAALTAPLAADARDTVLELFRAQMETIVRLRADNKQKTTLVEERTAHLRDMMVTQQKDAARQALRDVEEDGAGKRAAALEAVRRPHSSPTGAPAAAGAQ